MPHIRQTQKALLWKAVCINMPLLCAYWKLENYPNTYPIFSFEIILKYRGARSAEWEICMHIIIIEPTLISYGWQLRQTCLRSKNSVINWFPIKFSLPALLPDERVFHFKGGCDMSNRNQRRPSSDAHHLWPHLRRRKWTVCRDGGQGGLNDAHAFLGMSKGFL